MSTILLVRTKPVLAQAVRQLAQHNPDLHVLEAADPDEAVQRTEADPPGVAAVALGAADAEPLRISQRIHGIDRDISVALLAKPGDLPELRKALRMTPFLGGEIRCLSAADPQPTAEAVVEAAERRLQRQSFARATNRLNRRITEAITPPQIAAHFDKLLDRAPIGVVTVDRQGRIAGWNPQAGKLLDTSERRTLGQPLSTLFTSPERERVHDLLMRTITSDQPISEETVDRTSAKGQPQFLELSATAVELNPGTPGAIVLLQDVTAREQAERERDRARDELCRQRRWFEATLLSIGDAVIATDQRGQVTLMNTVAERLTGWPLRDAVGRDSASVFRLIEEASREKAESPVDRVLREGTIQGLTNHTLLLRRDGTEVPIDDSGAPIHDSEGHLIGVVLVFRDISRRRRAEHEMAASEQRLRLILESLTDYAIFTMDTEGRITGWNRGAQRLLGYAQEEVLGQSGEIIYTPEDREAGASDKEIRTALKEGRALDNRWHVRRSGERFWATGVLSLLRDEQGRPRGLVKILRDETEAKRSRDQLEARARQQAAVAQFGQRALAGPELQDLLDDATEVIARTLDVPLSAALRLLPDGQQLQVEAGAGWRPGVVGQALVGAGSESHAGTTLAAGKPIAVERMDRERRFTGSPLLHEHGAVSGATVIIAGADDRPWGVLGAHTRNPRRFSRDDVNFLQAMANTLATGIQRRAAERRLQRLNETLEQRVAERTAELKDRADQLRRLASQLTEAEQRERRRLAQVLHDHLQQLLVAAKMQTGLLKGADEQSTERVMGQLTELLDEAIDSSRSLSHELSPQVLYEAGLGPALEWLAPRMENQHGLRIYVAAEEEAEPDAEDVKVLLFQAVRELLMNVVKHAGVDEAWMRMRHEDGDRLRLEVEDRGPGFDPEQTDKGDGGEQLGLFGIRERLRALSGEMKIDSAPGEGTRITLFASIHGDRPAVAEQHPGAGEAAAPDLENALPAKPEPVVEGAALEPEAADLTAAHPIRVLLVDDHRIVREGLAGILRGEPDIELVAEASDGQEAVERTERTEPDVVVMDVSMPRMDGTEATRIIRRDHPEIRVIGLSMHDREDLAQAMHEAGASAYLTKGGPASELIETIREQVREQPTG